MNKKKTKLPRKEAVKLAQLANQVPLGLTSLKLSMRLPEKTAEIYQQTSSTTRGAIWSIGNKIQQDDFKLLYEVISRLGEQIVYKTNKKPFKIITKTKTYFADDEFSVLINIIEDLIK